MSKAVREFLVDAIGVRDLVRALDGVAMSSHEADQRIEACAPTVMVIGMHRSGTSAVAGSMTRLGFKLPPAADLFVPNQHNEKGYFESKSLAILNTRILEVMGGDWNTPPPFVPGWEQTLLNASQSLDPAFHRAVGCVLPSEPPFLWKDPRLSLLLPLWRRVLNFPKAAVLVYRDPIETARSLSAIQEHRIGFDRSLYLWQLYNYSALANLVGVPTLVVRFEDVLSEPDKWVSSLVDFLSQVGACPANPDVDAAIRFIDPGLRHRIGEPETKLPAKSAALLSVLDDLRGSYLSLPSDLGGELAATSDLAS